jgi:hypothetical protein
VGDPYVFRWLEAILASGPIGSRRHRYCGRSSHAGALSSLVVGGTPRYSKARDTANPPKHNFGDITQPTPGLVGFMADVAARLGSDIQSNALSHLDQGMGGGKSHALTGLWHMAAHPDEFFSTEVGEAVRHEAQERASGKLDLGIPRLVVLSADHMSPGGASPEFGPAKTLHERFLWALFEGGVDHYRAALAEGPNKAALSVRLNESMAQFWYFLTNSWITRSPFQAQPTSGRCLLSKLS